MQDIWVSLYSKYYNFGFLQKEEEWGIPKKKVM